MGSVEPYLTAAGRRYRVRWRTPDHKSRQKRGFERKADAERYLRTVEGAKDRGEYVDPASARVTVGELGREWLRDKEAALKPSTYRATADAWRVYVEPRWGATAVAGVQHSAVREWVQQLSDGTAPTARKDSPRAAAQAGRPKSATVVLRAHGVLASVLDIAVRDRRVSRNVARGLDNMPRKVSKAHVYLTHDDVDRLARHAGEHGTLVLTAAYTGLRWGELTGLRVRDVDALNRRLSVQENAVKVGSEIYVGTPKTHARRVVPYPAFLGLPIAKLCEGKGRDALLFGDGLVHVVRPRTSESSRSWFLTALEAAGLPRMTIHDLRHTAASLSISSGANVKAVQRMLGHKSAAMTLDVYADLFDEDLGAVADALDRARSEAVVAIPWPNPAARR
ncbi:tyrosine-type recombinase/integrase [Microbacterium sp. IEGM 1404]|uniref:tyrosine-type recombinase/integrase n=1 Tax=Microbacterium sp. IEGM 1404 TaxID=3047084 RepID=UPI0024B863B4|nr:site-specific integrase [Microbacterium sp. IEGM 1404]MDI9891940.1 site-specific integrase [Microbacterium sp. IEGM 1404]